MNNKNKMDKEEIRIWNVPIKIYLPLMILLVIFFTLFCREIINDAVKELRKPNKIIIESNN